LGKNTGITLLKGISAGKSKIVTGVSKCYEQSSWSKKLFSM
jgi:hypothetical protein